MQWMPPPPNQIEHLDLDHLALGKGSGEGLEGGAIGWIGESRHDHGAVGEIEVDVGKGEPAPVGAQARLGSANGHHLELSAAGIGGLPQNREIGRKSGVIGIVGLLAHECRDTAGSDKTGDVVDMPAGLVVEEAIRQPDDGFDPEIIAQYGLDRAAVETGVAPRVEHRGRAHQTGALPVDGDRPTFENDRRIEAR